MAEKRLEIWTCPECGRVEGPAFGMRPEYEPVVCNQRMRGLATEHETWEGFPVMHEVQVIPAAAPNVLTAQEADVVQQALRDRFPTRPAAIDLADRLFTFAESADTQEEESQ